VTNSFVRGKRKSTKLGNDAEQRRENVGEMRIRKDIFWTTDH
jgi:hypothetical protein